MTVDEERRKNGDIELRHESKVRKERYDEAAQWVIVGGLTPNKLAASSPESAEGTTRILYGEGGKHEAVIRHAPFAIDFKRDGQTHIQLNEKGLLNVEHWRAEEKAEPAKEGEEQKEIPKKPLEDTWWDESFGGATDTKPRGPESIGLDINFPGYSVVYGIPEHAGPLSLRETRSSKENRGNGGGDYSEPYRLFNGDVFEYIIDSPMTLYGSIPFMQAKKKDSTVGIFWLNAAETWIDITKQQTSANPLSFGVPGTTSTTAHFFSESGILDVFVFLGPKPQDMNKAYADLTGYTQLPQEFAVAYHQCRWNYITDEDVEDVNNKFNKFDMPMDVMWLDIDYLDGKKYFTWDPLTFGHHEEMQDTLADTDRKLVVIIDPHIKKESGYWVVDELTSKGLAVKNKENNDYEGWCWPGASHWIDCFNPAALEWTKSLYRYDRFKGSKPNTFIWNDMNEPSVFNGPETTMPRDNIHFGGWEHRDLHNINGMTFINSTYGALQVRDDPKGKTPTKRPFILTRSFFAGSQRIAAMWTGDNQAEWPHLKASMPMILNQGISGMPFAGADVGGFFGNTADDLLVRWYQAGAFYPFFRGHAHIESRRREPYLASPHNREIITQALRLRYSLMPAWYTAFYQSSKTGAPIVKPMFWEHPEDDKGFTIDDQMYLGSTGLLVKPVTDENANHVDIYLPTEIDGKSVPYYDYFTYQVYAGHSQFHRIEAPLEKIPLLLRAGGIVPRRDRPRRSSGLMKFDPLTLVVALDPKNATLQANGELYLDDGESYENERGAYIHRQFVFSDSVLMSEDASEHTPAEKAKSKPAAKYLKSMEPVLVEKIVIVGAPDSWKDKTSVSVSTETAGGSKEDVSEAEMSFHPAQRQHAAWAVVRRPGVAIGKGWKINFA